MHIAFAAPGLPGSQKPTGVLTYVEVMKKALQALGHQVSVVTGYEAMGPDGTVRPVPIDRGLRTRLGLTIDRAWGAHGGEGPGGARAVRQQFRAAHRLLGFDILEMEEAFGFAGLFTHPTDAPLVARLHGPHVFGREIVETAAQVRQGAYRIAAESRVMARAAAITCPSATLMAATLDHYRARPAIAQVIPNPIAAVPAAEGWSASDCDPDLMLCVGRFDLRKGADVAVEAFALAARAHPTLRLVMAGPDHGLQQPDGGRRHYADYVQTAVSPDLRDRITFLGPLPPAEIVAWRRRSGLAIVASRFENFAYSIAECMAIGAPAIVSDSFGNGEMILHGQGGVVVPVGDAAALARAMLDLVGRRERLAAMGAFNRARCRDWLAPERVARETVAVYEQVLARRRSFRPVRA